MSGAVDQSIKEDIKRSETRSLPLTLLILLAVFGSLVAAAVPVLLAGTTVLATFGLLSAVDNWIPVNSATSSMTLLIGMAVGVDYSLFFLRRVREERAHGVDESLRIAARTSGHVIVVSGLTVALCVTGLLFTGLDNLRGLTVSTILVVGLAVLASVTVLPATLSLLGTRVDRLRVPWLGKRGTRSRFWWRRLDGDAAAGAVDRARRRAPGPARPARRRNPATGPGPDRKPAAQRPGDRRGRARPGSVPRCDDAGARRPLERPRPGRHPGGAPGDRRTHRADA